MLLIVMFALGVIAGGAFGAYSVFSRLYPANVSMRERIEKQEAFIGTLSPSDVTEGLPQKKERKLKAVPAPPKRIEDDVDLHRLPSWSRVELAKDRARHGLPPNDDLKGLPSWSVVEIQKYRNRHGGGR